MELQTKALYNLIRLNALEDKNFKCEEWQIEVLRNVATESLFERLEKLGMDLDKSRFFIFADSADNPEELINLLVTEDLPLETHDQIYLVVFELWRRLLPEKQSLSIFCDELDERIHLYDHDLLESDEPIQDALALLKEVLEELLDEYQSPSEAYLFISQFLAHDLFSFLYDYVLDLIDGEDIIYAQELIDAFNPFFEEKKEFDLLKILADSDPFNKKENLELFIEEFSDEANVHLQMDVLNYLVESQSPDLFIKLMKKTLDDIQDEEQFKALLEIGSEFYRRLDQDQKEEKIQKILSKRDVQTRAFNLKDPDFHEFLSILIK